MEVIELKIDDLTPYDKNAKTHTDAQIAHIVQSIEQYGMNDPIGVWGDDNVIIEGHGRALALKKMGKDTAPCIRLDHLTDEERRAYTLVHNQTALETPFDFNILKMELGELADFGMDLSGFGFDFGKSFNGGNADVKEDNFECKLPDEPTTKLGDIYKLGNHRLMCGDSTDFNDVQKLIGDGKANLIITDPPYNVAYVGKTADALTIQNDKLEDSQFRQFLTEAFKNMYTYSCAGAPAYIFHASSEVYNFVGAFKEAGFKFAQTCIWLKNGMVMGRQDYQWRHEPVLYGWNPTGSHKWYSDRKQTTIWEFNKPTKNADHPTMKPIPLLAYPITNSSKIGDIVMDLFGGSGSTLIACEQTGRSARLMELDPKYCDVIVKRWEDFTNAKAELLTEGK